MRKGNCSAYHLDLHGEYVVRLLRDIEPPGMKDWRRSLVPISGGKSSAGESIGVLAQRLNVKINENLPLA